MSTIPPNWLGSIIQTQGAQARAAGDKQRENATQAEQVGGGSFAEKLQDVIENTSRDSQVYADAEGTGSQGRPFESPPQEEQPQEEDADRGAGHPRLASEGLDVQA